MITNVFLSVAEISLSVSAVTILLLILMPFCNKRYAAKWKYFVWIFLALWLLFPVSADMRRGVTEGLNCLVASHVRQTQDARVRSGAADADTALPAQPILLEIPPQLSAPIVPAAHGTARVTPLDVIAWVWFGGCAVCLFFYLFSYARYRRRILRYGRNIEDETILREIEELVQELRIPRKVRVVIYKDAESPMVIGVFKPMLVLPEERYAPRERFFILKHELIHLKRGDVFFKLLITAAGTVHWFNPVIWLMRKEAVLDMELSCDERVVRGGDYATRKAYTETLMSALHRKCARRTVCSTQFYEGKQVMKIRFTNLLKNVRKKNGLAFLALAVLLTVLSGTLVGCSVRGSDNADAGDAVSGSDTTPGNDNTLHTEANAQLPEGATDTNAAQNATDPNTMTPQGPIVIPADLDVPESVLEAAESLVTGWYLNAREYNADAGYGGWRISSLESVYTYEDLGGMALQVYRLNYEFWAESPENLTLAGGMSITADGWVTPEYPDGCFPVFEDRDGTLTFVTCLFENDCYPGDEVFTDDLRRQLSASSMQTEEGFVENMALNFCEAYFGGDTEAIKQYLTDSYAWDIDTYPDDGTGVEIKAVKGLNGIGNRAVGERHTVSVEFKDPGVENLWYLTMDMIKTDEGWKIEGYGVEG
ncbi:MAG: hypothetical protein NC079_12050 [Clostridium sp.]|nr:hypothetical protein [Acetatifactor muris]MCM1528282.1 hypothetical protein [Bacteroides sp.]MCM1564323.1 hypothetical protein [Clostridium sp.]